MRTAFGLLQAALALCRPVQTQSNETRLLTGFGIGGAFLGGDPREDTAVHGRSERGRGDARRVAGEDRRVYCRTGGGGRTKSRY